MTFFLSSSGALAFYANSGNRLSTALLSTVASVYSRIWVRVTRVSASGNITFFTSQDGVVWVQLGNIVADTPGALPTNSNVLGIGCDGTPANPNFSGRIYRSQILSGINGTVAFDANFSLAAKLATSFVESSANAATVTINTSGATGARISGERDLYQGTVANQPVYLAYSGQKYTYLNASITNYLSTPDSAALDIVGDIDLRSEAALDDWTPAARQPLIAKWDTGAGQRSYLLTVEPTTGAVSLRWSATGSTVLTATSTASPVVADRATLWIRAALRVSDGRCQFFTGTDGVNWTQLGADVTSGATSISSSTSPVALGVNVSAGTPTESLAGKIYRAQIYNGINGTLAFDFNAQNYSTGSTLLDASANAATITINGGATIVTAPALYFDGTNDYLKAPPFALSQPETVQLVFRPTTWTASDNIYDGGSASMALQQNPGSPSVRIFAGANAAQNGGFALKTIGLVSAVFNSASSLTRVNKTTAVTGDAGTQNANGFTVSARTDGGGTQYSNITTNEIAIYSTAQSTAQLDQFANYAGRKWGFTV